MSELTEDANSTVSKDDLFVQRDGEGELLPVIEEAPNVGEVEVIPMTYGGIREYFGPGTQMEDVASEDIAEILRNHVTEPDLSELTSDEVEEDMKPMVPQSLLLAVMRASGVDVNLDALENQEEPVIEEGN